MKRSSCCRPEADAKPDVQRNCMSIAKLIETLSISQDISQDLLCPQTQEGSKHAPDGQVCMTVQVWPAVHLKPDSSLRRHLHPVCQLVYNSVYDEAISADESGLICVWKVSVFHRGTTLSVFAALHAVCTRLHRHMSSHWCKASITCA